MVVAAGDDGDGAWGAWFSGSGRSSGEKQFWTWPEKVAGDGGSWVVAGDGRRKTFPAVAAGKREREREERCIVVNVDKQGLCCGNLGSNPDGGFGKPRGGLETRGGGDELEGPGGQLSMV
ncbi:hypothetical protein Tco_0367037 [Tanacetum coccineum]